MYVLSSVSSYVLYSCYLMNTRKTERIDYSIYNQTGEKVARKQSQSDMSLKELELEELTIVDSLNFHLALYDLNDLTTVEECKGASNTVTEIYNKYRSVHVVLRKELLDYTEKYPNFDKVGERVVSYLKSVKEILRAKDSQGQASALEADLHNLTVEVETLKNRVRRHNLSIENNILLLRDENIFDKYLTRMEEFINEFFSLSTRLRFICPEFDLKFGDDFEYWN